MVTYSLWTSDDAARHIAVPGEHDDKYSRGVLGVITGSERYPGAAVLGVEAALRTGVGMVRFLGDPGVASLVLQRRPEAVVGAGRVQAWLIGSGMDNAAIDDAANERITSAIAEGLPTVLDGGALQFHGGATGPLVITPHFGELARVCGIDRDAVEADPAAWASRASAELGVTVLLKGHTSHIAGGGITLMTKSAPSWLATAGAGDALGGILGALVATHARECAEDGTMLARLAATASVIQGLAAERASNGGPLTILDLAEAIPRVIASLRIAGRDNSELVPGYAT